MRSLIKLTYRALLEQRNGKRDIEGYIFEARTLAMKTPYERLFMEEKFVLRYALYA